MKIIISERQQSLITESKKIQSAQNLIDMAVEDYVESCGKMQAFRNLELALCKGFKNGTTKLKVLDVKKIHDHYDVKLSIHTDQEWFQRVDFQDFEISLQILVANIIGAYKYGFDIEDMELNDGEGEDMMYEQYEQNLIAENMTEENLRRLCYAVWDKQKKKGEEPHLDDVIYDITGIKKNTNEDVDTIRPIWYEYNGGFDVLYDKVKNKIDTKEYKLVDPDYNLDTIIKVVHLELIGYYIEIMVDVDPRGTMRFQGWDEETEEEYMVNDTIDAAYQEALSNYETGDLMGMIRSVTYDFFYSLLEKYGIPIDVDIELEEIHGAQFGINENTQKPTRKSDILKQIWDKEKKEKGYATFDEDILKYFGINKWLDIKDYGEFFNDYIGGEEKTIEIIDELSNNTFSTKDFPERIVGGYDFDWVITDVSVQDEIFYVEGKVSEGGSVTLMDGRYMKLEDALNDDDVGEEIQEEVSDVVQDCLNSLIYPRTGIRVTINYMEI
jgi:hypothetical protein